MCFKSKTCTLLFLMLVVTDLMWVSSGWTIRPSMMQPLQLLCSSQVCNRGYMSCMMEKVRFSQKHKFATSMTNIGRKAMQYNISNNSCSTRLLPDRCRSRRAATWWGSSGWSLPPIEAERVPPIERGAPPVWPLVILSLIHI